MVSREYPPMAGGVGRYTVNLTGPLRQSGIKINVVFNKMGKGDFNGISPNQYNSEVPLDIVNKTKPDLVHVKLFKSSLFINMLNLIKMRFK